MTGRLSRFFRPRSVAIIGGGAVARFAMENCARLGFTGPVWHVHPERGDFCSVGDLPEAPDAAFVGVNRTATIEVVSALREIGAGGAVAYASGFAEAEAEIGDGAGLQADLLAAAGEMVLIGPNCYGFLNHLDGAGLWPDQQGGVRCERGVAIITQSSNIAINLSMQRRGLPLAYLVTAGNQAQTGLAEIGAALLEDERVSALGLHIEGIGDLRGFETLAERSHALGKPIVALKAGISEQAQAAAVSHTASLAGSAAGASALLARLGVAQVPSLSALLEALKLLHVSGPLPCNRIVSMSCSGGEASLMADAATRAMVRFPPLGERQEHALRLALGPKVALANPLDYHTYIWGDTDAMAASYGAMMLGDAALGAVVADFPRTDRCSEDDWQPVVDAVGVARRASGKPMAVVATLPENLPEHRAAELIALGVAPLCGIDEALRAIEVAAWLGQPRAPAAPVLAAQPRDDAAGTRVLSEAEGKAALARFGLVVPRSRRVTDHARIADAAHAVGFPLVLKGEGIAHKTEAGAVVLNLNDAPATCAAAAKMAAHSYLLEEMITGGVAEVLVGVLRDPAHGFVLTLAAGGVLTELMRDSTSLLLPVSGADILQALNRLRIAPLLRGYRGAPGADMEAIAGAVLAVQDYVLAHCADLEEIEINPLICAPDRAVAADVLIRIGEANE